MVLLDHALTMNPHQQISFLNTNNRNHVPKPSLIDGSITGDRSFNDLSHRFNLIRNFTDCTIDILQKRTMNCNLH